MSNSHRWSLAALFLSFIAGGGLLAPAGCSKKSRSMSVLSTAPTSDATDVSVDATVSVTFSASVRESSLTPANFQVQGSESGTVGGTIAYTDGTRLAVFKPTQNFKDGEMVTVHLSGSIIARSGAGLDNHTFHFTIRPAVILPPPPPPPPPPPEGQVTNRVPAPYSNQVAADAVVYVEFAEKMDPLTFTTNTAWLEGSLGGRIEAELGDILLTGTRVALLAKRRFAAGERIDVHLGRQIKTIAGGSFDGEVFGFRVAASAPTAARLPGESIAAGGTIGLLALADLDLDGRPDLIFTNAGGSRLRIFRGLAAGRFEDALSLDVGTEVLALRVADIQRDGRMDLLAGGVDRAVTFFGTAGGIAFGTWETFPTGTAVRGIATGDFDRSGDPDVLLDTDKGLRIYLDGLRGTPAVTIGMVQASLSPVITSDVDMDGLPDLLYGDRTGDRLALHRGQAPSLFAVVENLALGGEGVWLDAVDLGGDKQPELLVHRSSAADSQLVVFAPSAPQGGQTGLQFALQAEAGVPRGTLAVADMDGDGLPDLIATRPDAGQVLLHLNRAGSFDFTTPQTLAEGFVPEIMQTADITGDGVLDVLIASGSEIRVFLSEGGTAPPPPPPPPPAPAAKLEVDSLAAQAGEGGKEAKVRLTSNVPVEGFTVALAYDPLAMVVESIGIAGTAVEVLLPEFLVPMIDASGGVVSLTVAFDLFPPFEGRTLPAGSGQAVASLRFAVPATATAGSYALDLKDGLGAPPLTNVVVHEGSSVTPELVDGTLSVTVPPPPNPNKLAIEPVEVARGTAGAKALVILTTVVPIDAYSVVGSYDPAITRITGFNLDGTVTGGLLPEFVVPSIRSAENFFAYTVIFDFSPPFDRQRILPAENQPLVRIVFDVPADVALGEYEIGLRNDLGDPPLSNSFVNESQSIFPDLTDGAVLVVDQPPPPPEKIFLRADVNGGGRVDLADYTFLLAFLYQSGAPPPCLDASDFDDNGLVNLTDAVNLIDYLFKGRPQPQPPFPLKGIDPTADDLGCETGL